MIEHIFGFCPDTLGHFDLLDILGIVSMNWVYYKFWFEVYFWRV